ncbi:MAG: YqzL family protein [Clostridia bacterium]|nr:YqzL family protein [Clostridia bacterium]
MIKKIAWDTFKKTGNIDTFMEYKQIENIENNIKEIQNITNLNLKDNNKK